MDYQNQQRYKQLDIFFDSQVDKKSWLNFIESLSFELIGELYLNTDFDESIDWPWWFTRAQSRTYSQAVDYEFNETSFGMYIESERYIGVEYFTSRTNKEKLPVTYKGQAPCLFLDRDGVVNVDKAYVYKISDIEWLPGVVDFINSVRKLGYKVVVLTNQSGVAKGYYELKDIKAVHHEMNAFLESQGASIDGWYFCPYHQDGEIEEFTRQSLLRKPSPGMALHAAKELNLDLAKSLMIGDKISDRLSGLDMDTFFLQGNYDLENEKPKFSDLSEIYEFIRKKYPLSYSKS